MKKLLPIMLLLATLSSCKKEKSTEQVVADKPLKQELVFPQDYLGIYKGDLNITTSNGTEQIPMEFHLLDAADSTNYGYKIFYGAERSERAYNLVRTHNPNLFLIDENNGIILESGYANGTLFSTYEVMGNLLNATEKFYEDRMEFTITMARVQDTSSTGTAESAIVKNYPVTVMQTATLLKEKQATQPKSK